MYLLLCPPRSRPCPLPTICPVWHFCHAVLTALPCMQAVQAAQVTMEDYAMSHVGLAPLQVVGYEGLLGTIALFGILMPIVYFIPGKDGQGLHEDSLETAYMVGLPPTLLRLMEEADVCRYVSQHLTPCLHGSRDASLQLGPACARKGQVYGG